MSIAAILTLVAKSMVTKFPLDRLHSEHNRLPSLVPFRAARIVPILPPFWVARRVPFLPHLPPASSTSSMTTVMFPSFKEFGIGSRISSEAIENEPA